MFTGCSMRGTFFRNCTMLGTGFIENDMTDAVLDGSNAQGAFFLRCNVTNISLRNTNVSETRFIDCTENGNPITVDWLRDRGASNADDAIVINSLDENPSQVHVAIQP